MKLDIYFELTFVSPQGCTYIDATCHTLDDIAKTVKKNARKGWVCTKKEITVYEGGDGLFSENYTEPTMVARKTI